MKCGLNHNKLDDTVCKLQFIIITITYTLHNAILFVKTSYLLNTHVVCAKQTYKNQKFISKFYN